MLPERRRNRIYKPQLGRALPAHLLISCVPTTGDVFMLEGAPGQTWATAVPARAIDGTGAHAAGCPGTPALLAVAPLSLGRLKRGSACSRQRRAPGDAGTRLAGSKSARGWSAFSQSSRLSSCIFSQNLNQQQKLCRWISAPSGDGRSNNANKARRRHRNWLMWVLGSSAFARSSNFGPRTYPGRNWLL
jgi:hypothetical protein